MLNGRVAVVTGGSRGIGKSIALKLANNGAKVAIFATRESETVNQTLSELKAAGSEAMFVPCDVSNFEQVKASIDSVIEQFGKIDILVNNAGITKDKLLMQMSEEDFDDVISVNLKGTYNTVKACIRPFIRNKYGKIINISSVVGLMGNPGQVNYAASKAGIVGLTKSLAKEYAAKGITCNAIAPGFIATDMTEDLLDKQEGLINMIPMKKVGNPEDIANLALFLASDMSSYITGEVIKVDGGMYI